MELIIDIGNTSAKIAVFNGDNIVEEFRTPNQDLICLPQIQAKYNPTKGIVSTVVKLSESVMEQLGSLPFEVMFLSGTTRVPTDVMGKYLSMLGADRVAAIVEAVGRYPDQDLLIVDAGTAITYEFIDAEKGYLGGNIAPGVQMRIKALSMFCDKLPLISSEGDTPAIGYDTATAIRSGVIEGVKHEIEGYYLSFKKEHPNLKVLVTGGNQFSFPEEYSHFIADKYIVLKGLHRILEYNDK